MKDKKIAILLCFFLGTLGVHRFYLGETGKGILYIFTAGGLFGIIPLADFIIWLLGSQESFDSKYNSQMIQKQQVELQKEMINEMKKNNS